jgi:hypothetical protein
MMRVLVACEFSGVVRDAFLAREHDAYSCDLLPATTITGRHYQEDVLDLLDLSWDLIIAHPPCTYLCNSGVRWLYKDGSKKNGPDPRRWYEMCKGADFFQAMLRAPAARVCVENPVMHKHALELIDHRQSQIVQPWMFGHGETKATGLWLKGLPPLVPTDIVEGREARIHKMPPSEDRGMLRSITYQGIADAMADQWGKLNV